MAGGRCAVHVCVSVSLSVSVNPSLSVSVVPRGAIVCSASCYAPELCVAVHHGVDEVLLDDLYGGDQSMSANPGGTSGLGWDYGILRSAPVVQDEILEPDRGRVASI